MNYNHVSATIGIRAVDPRTVDDNSVLKQMGCFRSNLEEQLSVMDAKLDSLLDMATSIQLLISKMNKERGLVENVVAAYPQITTRFGEKNQLPVPSSVPIATTVPDSVTSSNSIELMNKDTIQPEEKFEAKSETQQKSEIESGASAIVPEGAGRIVTVLSKETGNSDFELESSKNNVDKFGFGSELSKNNNAQEVFDGLTNWDLKPPEEVAVFVDSKKDIYAYMAETNEKNEDSAATWVAGSKMKNIEIHLVFDPGGCHMFDEIVMKVLCVTEMVETDLKIGDQVNGGPIFLNSIICDGMVGLESKFWEITMKVQKGKFSNWVSWIKPMEDGVSAYEIGFIPINFLDEAYLVRLSVHLYAVRVLWRVNDVTVLRYFNPKGMTTTSLAYRFEKENNGTGLVFYSRGLETFKVEYKWGNYLCYKYSPCIFWIFKCLSRLITFVRANTKVVIIITLKIGVIIGMICYISLIGVAEFLNLCAPLSNVIWEVMEAFGNIHATFLKVLEVCKATMDQTHFTVDAFEFLVHVSVGSPDCPHREMNKELFITVVLQGWWCVDVEVKNHANKISRFEWSCTPFLSNLYKWDIGLEVVQAQYLRETLHWEGVVKNIKSFMSWLKGCMDLCRLQLSRGDTTLSRGEYCHVHDYDGIGIKGRQMEEDGSVEEDECNGE